MTTTDLPCVNCDKPLAHHWGRGDFCTKVEWLADAGRTYTPLAMTRHTDASRESSGAAVESSRSSHNDSALTPSSSLSLETLARLARAAIETLEQYRAMPPYDAVAEEGAYQKYIAAREAFARAASDPERILGLIEAAQPQQKQNDDGKTETPSESGAPCEHCRKPKAAHHTASPFGASLFCRHGGLSTYSEEKEMIRIGDDQRQEPELRGESTMGINSHSAPPCDPRYEDPTIPLAESLRVAIQHCNAGGDSIASDAIRSLVVLARRGASFRAALSRVDDVLFEGESPSLNDLGGSAHADPSNMARCYAAIHEIVVTAFRDEVARLNSAAPEERDDATTQQEG